jgi:hypothetical protein
MYSLYFERSFSNRRPKKGMMSVIEKTEKMEKRTLKIIF